MEHLDTGAVVVVSSSGGGEGEPGLPDYTSDQDVLEFLRAKEGGRTKNSMHTFMNSCPSNQSMRPSNSYP